MRPVFAYGIGSAGTLGLAELEEIQLFSEMFGQRNRVGSQRGEIARRVERFRDGVVGRTRPHVVFRQGNRQRRFARHVSNNTMMVLFFFKLTVRVSHVFVYTPNHISKISIGSRADKVY